MAAPPLADLLKSKRRLTVDEALPIARQLAAAIDAMHRVGVVHGKLTTQDVLLDEDRVSLRESERRGDAGPLDDIYGFGAIAFEMLTGKQPSRLYAAQLPPRWRRMIVTCLARDPRQRFLSAGAAIASLSLKLPPLTTRQLVTIAASTAVIAGAVIGGAIIALRGCL